MFSATATEPKSRTHTQGIRPDPRTGTHKHGINQQGPNQHLRGTAMTAGEQTGRLAALAPVPGRPALEVLVSQPGSAELGLHHRTLVRKRSRRDPGQAGASTQRKARRTQTKPAAAQPAPQAHPRGKRNDALGRKSLLPLSAPKLTTGSLHRTRVQPSSAPRRSKAETSTQKRFLTVPDEPFKTSAPATLATTLSVTGKAPGNSTTHTSPRHTSAWVRDLVSFAFFVVLVFGTFGI